MHSKTGSHSHQQQQHQTAQNYANAVHQRVAADNTMHSRLSPSHSHHTSTSQQPLSLSQPSVLQTGGGSSKSTTAGHHSPIVHSGGAIVSTSGGQTQSHHQHHHSQQHQQQPPAFNASASAGIGGSITSSSGAALPMAPHVSVMPTDHSIGVLQSPGSQNTSGGSLMDLDPTCGGSGAGSHNSSLGLGGSGGGGGLKITFERQPNTRILQLQEDAPGRRSR